MFGRNVATPGTTRLAPTSRSELREAISGIRKYLYLARTTSVDDVLSLTNLESTQSVGRQELLDNIKIQDNMLSIVYGEGDVTSTDRAEGAKASDAASKKDPSLSEPSVVSIPLDAFINVSEAPPKSNLPKDLGNTDISLLSILNSGKGINFSGRYSEYVAVFANLIPTVELSKCVPYFTIKFVQNVSNRKNESMPFLTLDSFVGAARSDSKFSTQNSTNTVPNAAIYQPVENPTGKIGGTVTGMELFQAPQTLVRPYVDKTTGHASTRGIPVLDPMVPLVSIESMNFDVSALSQNFMTTQTKIDLSLILHDRSRLIEISPIVSPGVYPTIRSEIEWGWAHPDSSKFSVNPYAKFLNALRSKQVFGLVGSSFSNRDANSLSIKLQLMGLGEFVANSTSILTGELVPYELLRARMNQLFNIIDSEENGQKVQKFVGSYEQTVSLSNWETGDKWVRYEDYRAIVDIITNSTGLTESKIQEIITKYADIVTNKLEKVQTKNGVSTSNPTATLRTNLLSDISSYPVEQSPYIYKLYPGPPVEDDVKEKEKAVQSKLASAGISQQLSFIANDTAIDEGAGGGSSPLYAVGDLIYRLYCVPLAITGLFDEIRVNIFDFNDHAGRMGSLNIGSFVVGRSIAMQEVLKTKMTAQKALQRIIGLINNPAAAPYGVKKALIDKRTSEKRLAENNDSDVDTTDDAKREYEEVQSKFNEALAAIYKEKEDAGLGSTYEIKFTAPRVKAHTEVTSVRDGDVYKQVLNVFIYDEANSGARSVNLLMAISQTPSGRVQTLNAGSDTKLTSGILNLVKNEDGTYTVAADRQTTKNAITAAVPTLRIGSEGSVITNASYSSTGGGDLTNINLMKTFQNSGGNTRADVTPGLGVDMFVIPATVNITMLGMPLINRGQMYYIDFGTGTSLDNVYTVTSVKHSIKGGQFTTTVTLNPISSGSIKSVTSGLNTDLAAVKKYKQQNSKTPA
jgi:hypothetical protein